MKAVETQVGETYRRKENYHDTFLRVDNGDKLTVVTRGMKLIDLSPEDEVFPAFAFDGPEGMDDYTRSQKIIDQVLELMATTTSISNLNRVHSYWEERMKELAAETLKPGSDETIEDLDALDYIWDITGDKAITGDQPYHARALDYYLGRKVEHIWGVGVLSKMPENTPGGDYGIKVDYPCTCGKKTYEMYAIPGVHIGGFAYLVEPGNKHYLDVRNQCRVCEECASVVERQLEMIDQISLDKDSDETD